MSAGLLFERRHQAVLLNPDGAQLLAEIGPALEELGHAMERAAGQAELMRLELGGAAALRLLPADAAARRAAGSSIPTSISTSTPGRMRWPGSTKGSTPRSCSPARSIPRSTASGSAPTGWSRSAAARCGAGRSGRARRRDRPAPPRPARRLRLLARGGRLPDLEPAAIDHFDSGQLILDAAAQGLGVAFMFDMHLEGAHDPRLASLFGIEVESPYAYFFACRRAALGRRPVRIFHDWLIGEVVESREPV